MLAAATVLRALSDVEPVGRHSVAVTAAAAASALVVHAQLDATEGTCTIDDESDRLLCLGAQRVVHAVTVPVHVSAPVRQRARSSAAPVRLLRAG